MARPLNPGEITAELVARLDRPAPRYTSYPTAPEWNEGFRAGDFAAALRRADESTAPIALYVHVPFCAELCHFCGCTVVIGRQPERDRAYVARLRREIGLLTQHLVKRRVLGQVHLGGGTPTHLSPAQLRELMTAIRSAFTIAPGAELSVEVDPRVTSMEHWTALRELGFTRASLGIQDFDPAVQKAVNRVQSEELTRESIEACRALGFTSVNVDLMYGLPRQTPETFQRTLEAVAALRPDRIACFGYAHVPWLKKAQLRFERDGSLPTAEQRCRLFVLAIETFTRAGYRSIGMDHFALPGDDLTRALDGGTLTRSFMGYTTRPDEDLLGIGHSAISDLARAYAQNARTLPEYELAIDRGELATCRGHLLTDDDILRRAVIQRIMSADSLVYSEFEARFAIDFKKTFRAELADLLAFEDHGLLTMSPDRVEITSAGRIFVRNLAMCFDRYLREGSASGPRFSRTL